MASVHPISLLSRTEAEISTLYHSFYFMDTAENNFEIVIVKKIPLNRSKMDDIEAGLKMFATNKDIDGKFISTDHEKYDYAVMTSSDGTRFFSYWIQIGHKKIAAVSKFSLLSFTRNIFKHLKAYPENEFIRVIETLCKLPIFPACGIKYEIQFPKGILPLQFSSIEQPEDSDTELVALSVMTPNMLIDAWESIVLEKKVIVASSNKELIFPCCEFLRKLILPLKIINTYIPYLTEDIIQTIEAPFPYLVGADKETIYKTKVEIYDSVIVDLDLREVIFPKDDNIEECIPGSYKLNILKSLSHELDLSISKFMTRSSSSSSSSLHPYENSTLSITAASIQEKMIRINHSLMTARECTVRAFFRVPEGARFSLPRSPGHMMNSMGFDYRNSIYCGWMQLIRQDGEKESKKYLPTWVEMDDKVFCVYEHADELPLLYLFVANIVSVSPSPVEPEGHVFDLEVKPNQSTYRFATTDSNARREWIKTIEEFTKPPEPEYVTDLLKPATEQPVEIDRMSSQIDLKDDDHSVLNKFRAKFMATQMTSYLRSQIECEDFESIFADDGIDPSELSNSQIFDLDPSMEFPEGIWSNNDISMVLDKIASSTKNRAMSPMSPPTPRDSQISRKYSIDGKTYIDLDDQSIEVQNYLSSLTIRTEASTDDEDSFAEDKPTSRGNLPSPPKIQNSPIPGKKTLDSINNPSTPNATSKNNNPDSAVKSTGNLTPPRGLSPTRVSLMNVPGFKTIDSTLEAIIDGKQIFKTPSNVWPWSQKPTASDNNLSGNNNPKKTINSAGGGGLFWRSNTGTTNNDKSKQSEIKTSEQLALEAERKMLHSAIVRVTATYRSCEDLILKSTVNERLALAAVLEQKYHEYKSSNEKIENGIFIPLIISNKVLENEIDEKSDDFNWIKNIWENLSSSLNENETNKIYTDHLETFSLELSKAKTEGSSTKHLTPILIGIIGYLHQKLGNTEEAIIKFASSKLIDHRRIMKCIAKKFLKMNKKNATSKAKPSEEQLIDFIYWGMSINKNTGLQVYRLLSGLMHRRLVNRISESLTVNFDDSMALGSQRYFPSDLIGEGAVFGRELLYGKLNRRRNCLSAQTNEFLWTQSSKQNNNATSSTTAYKNATGVLNESVQCSHTSSSPCYLSISLLTKLREIMKSACDDLTIKSSENLNLKMSTPVKFKFGFSIQQNLRNSSAFKSFERECCQFQVVDLSSLSEEEKVLFWCNVYNIFTVHTIIQSPLTTTFTERYNILKAVKYNIGGNYYNLLDIEHGILRAKSSKPVLFGPFNYTINFSDKDPRKEFVLKSSWPLISFGLFTASSTSPGLNCLKNAKNIRSELAKCASVFIQDNIKIEKYSSTFRTGHNITLPQIIKTYSKDFGESQSDILSFTSQYVSSSLSIEIKSIIDSGGSFKLIYVPFDWQLYIVL